MLPATSYDLGRVNVRDDHLGALVGEQPRALGADAPGRPRDDGDLAGQQLLGVAEVAGDLVYSARHGGGCVLVLAFRVG